MTIEAITVTTTHPVESFQRLSEADADPHHTIADVLEELLIPDPLAVAETGHHHDQLSRSYAGHRA